MGTGGNELINDQESTKIKIKPEIKLEPVMYLLVIAACHSLK